MRGRFSSCAAALALVATATGLSAQPAAAQPVPGTSCPLFPADSVFNTDISALPVNSQSSAWMSNMTQSSYIHPDLGTFAQWYGIPINVAPPPTSGVTPSFLYDSESDHPTEGYPIDQNTLIEGGPGAPTGSDRHALVVSSALCKLYEIYNLQNFTNGQTPQAGSGADWDLASDAMRPDGWTSADAAGLPMMPLLLRPDEILAGSITHAIRFTTHCTNGYIWPASHNAGLCSNGFPPFGARFRLRSSFDISHFSATTQVVLRAFQHYGLILADNGADWYFQGSTDNWWGTTAGSTVVSELKTIPASQFDAVDESGLQAATNSYRAIQGCASLGGTPVLADFSGDAKADLALVSASGVCAVPSSGSAFASPWTLSAPFYGARATLAGDLNGDGKADLVAVNDHDAWVLTSSGSGFNPPAQWSNVAFYGSRGTFVGDVNGDGKADLVAVNDGSAWVMLSSGSGSGFAGPVRWSSSLFYGSVATLVADVTGDGKPDLLAVNSNSTWVMASSGSGFAAPTQWSNQPFYGSRATLAASISGSGKADLVAVNGGDIWVMTSTGSAFSSPSRWSSTPFYGAVATLAGDLNTDGKADLLAANRITFWVALSQGTGFQAPTQWTM